MSDKKRKCIKATNNAPASDAIGSMASALAIGYLLFKDKDTIYANDLLDIAKKMFTFAETYLGLLGTIVPSEYSYHGSGGLYDQLAEAAGLLYKATQIESYKTKAQ